jgi:hypothetical protein
MGEREADDETDADEGADEPFGDLADRVRRRRGDRDDDAFAALEDAAGGRDEADPDPAAAAGAEPAETTDEDPFESVGVDEIDTDELWASLESESAGEAAGTDDGSAAAEQPEVGSGGAAERVERDDPEARRVDHLVPKAAYCQRCRHLAAPPEVRCTHEGTEIVEVADADHFRVRGCPMVDEDGPVEGTPDLDG